MAKLVSKTYGEALFRIALEKESDTPGKAEDFLTEIEALVSVLDENPGFGDLMRHPGIAKTEKLNVVQKVFEGRVSPEIYEFLKLIITKDRYGDLDDILEYFREKMKEYKQIATVYVTTAVELTEAQRIQVEKRVLETAPCKSTEMHYAVDPGLIGGMVIRIKDRVVDSSIRRKLDDLTKQLLQIQLG